MIKFFLEKKNYSIRRQRAYFYFRGDDIPKCVMIDNVNLFTWLSRRNRGVLEKYATSEAAKFYKNLEIEDTKLTVYLNNLRGI